jgi:glutamate 5-kinase
MDTTSVKNAQPAVIRPQALYETMFRNYGILVGQVLVTKPDFYHDETRHQVPIHSLYL